MKPLAHYAVPYLDLLIAAAVLMACITAALWAAGRVERWLERCRVERETDALMRVGMKELQRKGELP